MSLSIIVDWIGFCLDEPSQARVLKRSSIMSLSADSSTAMRPSLADAARCCRSSLSDQAGAGAAGRVRIGAGSGVAIGACGMASRTGAGRSAGACTRAAGARGAAVSRAAGALSPVPSPSMAARRLRSMRSRTYSWNESVLMAICSVSSCTESRKAGGSARRVRMAGMRSSARLASEPGWATGARLSSAAAITSNPPSVARLERMTALSPKAWRALAMASREVGAVNRWMFMLQAPQESGRYG